MELCNRQYVIKLFFKAKQCKYLNATSCQPYEVPVQQGWSAREEAAQIISLKIMLVGGENTVTEK